jgi:PAS domain S-box-containing protein
MIIDIVRTHPVVLVGGVLQENPFYVPPDEFLAELRAREGDSRSRRGGARKATDKVDATEQTGASDATDAAETPDRAGARRLSNTLGGLVALGTMSSIEASREPAVMAGHFAEAVLPLSSADLVCINADFPPHWSGVTELRVTDDLRPAPSFDEVKRAVIAPEDPPDHAGRRILEAFAGLGPLSLFVIPLGPNSRYGWMAAGSRTPGFPDDLQRALLEVGAQQLSAGLRDRYLADLRATEASLREADERFRLAFEHAAVGMALLTPEGRFAQCNPAICRIVGREEKDLLAIDWQSVTAPADLPRALAEIRPLVAGETKSVIVRKRCLRPDGEVVWVQNSLSMARDASGRPRHLVMLMEDITDQRKAEEAVRFSEARFSRLFRDSPAALAMTTIEGARVIDVNDHWLELFGYRRDEVLGHTAFELRTWADPSDRARAVERLLKEGVVRDLQTRFRRKSGELRDTLVSFIRAELPGEEEPVVLAMFLDITDRRRVEIERARLDSITDTALSYLGLDGLLRELLGRLRSSLKAEVASVWLVDEDAEVFVLRAVDGVAFERIADVRIPLDSSERLKLDAPYVDNDLQPPPKGRDDWRAREWSAIGLPLRAEMGAPLRVEGKAIGVVRVGSTRTPFAEEDQRLLHVVADRAAPAIERGRLLETVGESRRRLAVLSQRLVEVQETERREISRELHDEVGQLLTGLLFKIESHSAGSGRAKDEMRVIVNDLIDRVRDLSMNLRPPMLDDLGLLSALTWQIRRFGAQTGIQVRFRYADLDRRFGGQVEITAFRIVQEALTNVARHAGVKQAKVDVWANAASLGVRIEDEGGGFDVGAALAARSTGLEGMRERSRLAGGRLSIESAPGKGTRLSIELPLDPGSVRNHEKG